MSAEIQNLLSAHDLGVDVPGRQLVEALDVSFARGEFVAILGRNGVGKTLTLSTLAGLRQPNRGQVRLDGDDIGALKRQDIATRLALLPQSVDYRQRSLPGLIGINLDVIKSADWLIDLGPEGGDQGGEIVAEGTPQEVAKVAQSHTGKYLKQLLQETKKLS